MANQKLQISFTKLTTGTWFKVEDLEGAENFTLLSINVVDSEPLYQEVITTEDVPIDVRTETAMERVVEEALRSSFVTSAEYEGTSLFVEFDGTFTAKLTLTKSSAADFEFVSLVGVLGDRFDQSNPNGNYPSGTFGDVKLDNLRIDSLAHKLTTFTGYTERTTNVAANTDNKVESTLTFTSAETLTNESIKLYWGWVEKDDQVYNLPEDYTIDINKFKDPYQSSVTQFVIDAPSSLTDMKHVQPKHGQTGFATIDDLGNDQYEIKLTQLIPELPFDDNAEIDNYTIPENLNGGKTLKPVFQLDIIKDKLSNAPEQSTTRINLSDFFDKGSIGHFDQVFQTGEKFFSLTTGSLNFNNGTVDTEVIDSSRDTTISFTIEHDDQVAFALDDEIELIIQDVELVTTEAGKSKTFIQNQKRDAVLAATNNTPVNSVASDFTVGTRIRNFTCEIDNTDNWKVNCTATIPKLTVTGFYAIKVAVSRNYDTVGFATAQNIYIQNQVAESGGDESVIFMDVYNTQAQRTDFNFYPHWQSNENEINGTFNEVRAFPEDHYACRFRIVNEDADNTILQSFAVRIKGRESGVVQEQYNFNLTGQTYQRNWNLEQQFQNEVTFTPDYGFETGKDQYFINYAFQIEESWSNLNDLVLEWVGVYDQTLEDGTEVTFSTFVQSPDFIIGNYDQTENTSEEPQTLNPSGKVEFFNASTGEKVSKMIEVPGTLTRVKYTFEEDNLNDLQAVPIDRPYTFTIPAKTEGNLTGYLDIVPQGGTANERWRFHNFEENKPSFWSSVAGHTDVGYAKIVAEDADTATIEALIDGNAVIKEFGGVPECYNFSARIDKVQTAPPGLALNTDIYVFIDTTSFLGTSSAAVAEQRINSWFLTYVRQTREAGQNFVGNLIKVYTQGPSFTSSGNPHLMERWLGYINAMVDNAEAVDFENLTGLPVGTTVDTRAQSYAPGLITIMRATDIDVNGVGTTIVRGNGVDDNIITNTGLDVYYNSFFDSSSGLVHQESILDFFSEQSTSITVNDDNVTVYNSNTTSDVIKYNHNGTSWGGLNPNYDRSLLNFKGFYNEGGNTDVTQDVLGNNLSSVFTPSNNCLFIPFIDDISGVPNSWDSYANINGLFDIRGLFEPTALNTPSSSNDFQPTWIFRNDKDYFDSVARGLLNSFGCIIYSCNGMANRQTLKTQGALQASHISILRALKRSTITYADMLESTFLAFYDINGGGTGQTYNSLQQLNDVNSANNLLQNPNFSPYNDMENQGFTSILDFGDYASGQGFIGNIDQTTFNSQITQGINDLT